MDVRPSCMNVKIALAVHTEHVRKQIDIELSGSSGIAGMITGRNLPIFESFHGTLLRMDRFDTTEGYFGIPEKRPSGQQNCRRGINSAS